jgi:hypothetical protein
MTIEIGLGLVEFGIITLGPTVNPPVQITDGIPRRVLPVVGKLGAESFERTPMGARAQAFDNFTRDQLQVPELLQKLRVQIVEIR